MILAANLFAIWLIVNVFLIIPKRLNKDELLFLFLISSLVNMILLLGPAHKIYFGKSEDHFSVMQMIAFIINRNFIFPFLTLITINLMKGRTFINQLIVVFVSIIVTIVYSIAEGEFAIPAHYSLPTLILFFLFYYYFHYLLTICFRYLDDKRAYVSKP